MFYTPSQLIKYLAVAISARQSILVVGAPGVGKTDIIEQASAAAGADYMQSHPATENPTDIQGMPWPDANNDTAKFLPFGNLARALKATKPLVWVLEDLGQARPAVQASYMQLLLARRVGDFILPKCVVLIATSNRRSDKAGVGGMLEPVKSRFSSIIELVPDLNDWCQWALTKDYIPSALIAYLRFKPDMLCQFNPTADLINSPIPRTWANAGRQLTMGLPKELEGTAVAGAVGTEGATDFMAFLEMYRNLPTIDAFLMDPDGQDLPNKLDVLHAVCTGLAARADANNFSRVSRFIERLVEAGHGEFAAYTLRDIIRRDPDLQSTPEFVQLTSGELGAILTGTSN